MQPARSDETPIGHFYKVGENWYVDEAYLRQAAAHRAVELHEEPFGYRLLSPFGMLNLRPEPGTSALPHQSGTLYLCGRTDEAGSQLHALAREHRLGAHGGTWASWPTAKNGTCGKSCGCKSCQVGGTGGTGHTVSHDHIQRLLTSESLGMLTPQGLDANTILLEIPSRRSVIPEWVCGRRHECIREVLQWDDLGPNSPGSSLVSIELDDWPARPSYRLVWALMLDRRRTTLIEDIVRRSVQLATQIARGQPASPEEPPVLAPGRFAWFSAILNAGDAKSGNCETCPYRLGTNLRCAECRRWHHARARPVSDLRHTITHELSEQRELQGVPPQTIAALGVAVEQILTGIKLEPLTDRYFTLLERGILMSLDALSRKVSAAQVQAILDIAGERSFHIAARRPQEAA